MFTIYIDIDNARLWLSGQDHITYEANGVARRLHLEELEKAAFQPDAEMAAVYQPIYDASVRLHNEAVSTNYPHRSDVPTQTYIPMAVRREREAAQVREQELARREMLLREAEGKDIDLSADDVGIGSVYTVGRNMGQIVEDGACVVEVAKGMAVAVRCRLDQSDRTVRVLRVSAAGRPENVRRLAVEWAEEA